MASRLSPAPKLYAAPFARYCPVSERFAFTSSAGEKFSQSWRCASVASESNTIDDFPEPDSPVK